MFLSQTRYWRTWHPPGIAILVKIYRILKVVKLTPIIIFREIHSQENKWIDNGESHIWITKSNPKVDLVDFMLHSSAYLHAKYSSSAQLQLTFLISSRIGMPPRAPLIFHFMLT